MEHGTDFIATELLQELKESNARKDSLIVQQNKNMLRVICGFLIVILAIVAGFLLYLNQYDFESTDEFTYDYDATGVYALVDSEGNVIAQDLTPQEIESIMEVINSNGESTQESDRQKDPLQD